MKKAVTQENQARKKKKEKFQRKQMERKCFKTKATKQQLRY